MINEVILSRLDELIGDYDTPFFKYLLGADFCIVAKIAYTIVFKWGFYVGHVVSNALHFITGDLGCSHIHKFIYLHGIAGYYFCLKLLCKSNRKSRFAAARGADDKYHVFLFHILRLFLIPIISDQH